MILGLLTNWLHGVGWLWNNPGSYNFVSGPLPDITMIGGGYAMYRKHNCHVKRCWRIQWRKHGDHELCRKHHPADPPTSNEVK